MNLACAPNQGQPVEGKQAFTSPEDLYGIATPPVDASVAIPRSDVIDLTSRMRADGSLDWQPPAGDWVILRFGYSLLGITNHPATAEATGLEVDKLNHLYVKNYMENYLASYRATVGPDLMGSHGIRYVVTDSWEAGSQNWTDDMIAQVQGAPGLRPCTVDARPGRARRGERRGERPLPLGLQEDHWRPDRGRALRPGPGVAQGEGHGPLRRVARGWPRARRRRHGGEEARRHPDERHVDAALRRERGGATTTTRTTASPPRWRTSTARTSRPPSR